MYRGPVRAEPLAVELHNTLYADGGELRDGLAADAPGFLSAIADRLPADLPRGPMPTAAALTAHRDVVRAALTGDRRTLRALNASAARAAASPSISPALELRTNWHGATKADVVIGAFAADAIRLLAEGTPLQQCGAPGCVLLYVRDHPRRQWCSPACGNRARQARHYAKVVKRLS